MNSAQDFIARVLETEGGYVNDPLDPGGETNFGITQPMLKDAIAQGVVPPGTSIANLIKEQAASIYYALVWKADGLDQFSPALGFQVLDMAVNSGIHEARITLQRAAGVTPDGEVGPQTIAAVQRQGPQFVCRFIAERLDFLARLPGWAHDGRGWAHRIAQDLRFFSVDA